MSYLSSAENFPLLPVAALIESIARQQWPEKPGAFPCVRVNHRLGYRRQDENCFISLTVARVLNECARSESQPLLATIHAYLQGYRFKDHPTVNFYRRHDHYNHGYLFRHINHLAIANDADDTALYHSAFPSPDEHKGLVDWLTRFTTEVKIDGQILRPFSTWLGHKMAGEAEACVLANVLIMWKKNDLPLNQTVHDSAQWLQHKVARPWWQSPYYWARYYPYPAVIAYHLARVWHWCADLLPDADRFRQQLLAALPLFEPEEAGLHRLLWENAWRWLGTYPPTTKIGADVPPHRGEPYFIAPMLSSYQRTVGLRLAGSPWTHIAYDSPVLLPLFYLEHQLLHQP